MPETCISPEDLTDGAIGLVKLLTLTGLASSNGDARRTLTKDKCVCVNGERVCDAGYQVPAEALTGDGVVLRKGKKIYHRVHL